MNLTAPFSFFRAASRCLLLAGIAGAASLPSTAAAPEGSAAVRSEKRSPEPLGARSIDLPLRVADGLLGVPVTLFNDDGDREVVVLEIDLDFEGTLELHPDLIEWLRVPPPEPGTSGVAIAVGLDDQRPVAIHTQDIDVTSEQDFQRQNDVTVTHAEALQERRLKGRLGLGFFKHYPFVLNMSSRMLRLSRPGSPGPHATRGGIKVPFMIVDGKIGMRLAGRNGGHVALGSRFFENRIYKDQPSVRAEKPGHLSHLELESTPAFDLAKGLAWRPVERASVKAPASASCLAFTGTDFLSKFEVSVDWSGSRVFLTPTTELGAVPTDQADYFSADQAGTAEALENFLSSHPRSHFAREAAETLLQKRLREMPLNEAQILKALRSVAETAQPKRRLEACVPAIESLSKEAHLASLTAKAGLLALEFAKDCVSVHEIYRLHRMIGVAQFQQGDLEGSWRHLVSASFVKTDVDPEHLFLCAFYLGRLYEAQGRTGRAYSRYQAALKVRAPKWTPPEALRSEAEASLAKLRTKLTAEQIEELDSL